MISRRQFSRWTALVAVLALGACGGSAPPSDAGVDAAVTDGGRCLAPGSYRVVVSVFDEPGSVCEPQPDRIIDVTLPLTVASFYPDGPTGEIVPTGACAWAVHYFENPIEGTITIDGTVSAFEPLIHGEFAGVTTDTMENVLCRATITWESAPAP